MKPPLNNERNGSNFLKVTKTKQGPSKKMIEYPMLRRP